MVYLIPCCSFDDSRFSRSKLTVISQILLEIDGVRNGTDPPSALARRQDRCAGVRSCRSPDEGRRVRPTREGPGAASTCGVEQRAGVGLSGAARRSHRRLQESARLDPTFCRIRSTDAGEDSRCKSDLRGVTVVQYRQLVAVACEVRRLPCPSTCTTLILVGRWMRMICIPNQSSLPQAWKQFTKDDRLMPSSNRDRLVGASLYPSFSPPCADAPQMCAKSSSSLRCCSSPISLRLTTATPSERSVGRTADCGHRQRRWQPRTSQMLHQRGTYRICNITVCLRLLELDAPHLCPSW